MKDFIITSNGNLINYIGKNACNATITSHYIIITLYIKKSYIFYNFTFGASGQDDEVKQQMNNQIHFFAKLQIYNVRNKEREHQL